MHYYRTISMEKLHSYEQSRFIDARESRGDKYVYRMFNEKTSPKLAELARQIHARSYIGEGFINQGALADDGEVKADIDKARGEYVHYYLGYEETADGKHIPHSTIRKVNIPYHGTVADLPAYNLCKDTLYKNELEWLLSIEDGQRRIKEISAFGHIPEVSAISGLELMRNVLQDSSGSGEIWFFSMVKEKYETLLGLFGPEAVRKIGESIALDDNRVGDVHLVPAIVDTDCFYDQVLQTALRTKDERQRNRYMKYLTYFTEGMSKDELSQQVYEQTVPFRKNTPSQLNTNNSLEDMITNKSHRTDKVWVQPSSFDLSSWADRAELKRRFEDGSIQKTIDPDMSEDLFELKYPELKQDDQARQEFIQEYRSHSLRTGRWFHFPWSRSLIHYLDKDDHQDIRTFRNRNMVTADEQKKLLESKISIAGLSVGSNVVEQLLYGGIGGSYSLADFDTLSLANTNRIKASMTQVGMNKLTIMAQKMSEVDPYLDQIHQLSGITTESLTDIANFKPDIIFDEVDNMETKARLRVLAAQQRIPLIMATDVGNNSVIDIERYDLDKDSTPFNGRLDKNHIDMMMEGKMSDKEKASITARLVGLSNASFRLIESTLDRSLGGIPQLGTTASAGGVFGALVAKDILLGMPVPSGRRVIKLRNTLGLKSQTKPSEAIKITKNFIKDR